tara:strand:- start:3366 stop:3575 length:210 start_codon:yes stop_codon:yes gene_type:complete
MSEVPLTRERIDALKKLPTGSVLWQCLDYFERIITTTADSGTLKGIAKAGIKHIITVANDQYDENGKLK